MGRFSWLSESLKRAASLCQEFSYDELNQFGVPAETQAHHRKFDENQYDSHHPTCNTCSQTFLARFKDEERKLARIKRQIMELKSVPKIKDTGFRNIPSKHRKTVRQILWRSKERIVEIKRLELERSRAKENTKKTTAMEKPQSLLHDTSIASEAEGADARTRKPNKHTKKNTLAYLALVSNKENPFKIHL